MRKMYLTAVTKLYSHANRRTFASFVTWKDNVATSSSKPIDPNIVNRSFTDFVFNGYSFKDQPDSKKALIDGQSVRTFGDLRRDVAAIRNFVSRDLKLEKGDTITYVSPNHVDYFSIIHGFCSAGVVVSPVNPLYTHHEIEYQLKKSKSKAVVTHVSCLQHAEQAAKSAGVKHVVVVEDDNEDGSSGRKYGSYPSITRVRLQTQSSSGNVKSSRLDIVGSGRDLAVLPFSSGTTGLPKGTMLSHGNLCANLAQLDECEAIYFKSDDVIISPLPMFHIYGFSVSLNLSLMEGKALVTMRRVDLEKYCQAVQDNKCTRGHVVPPIVLGLAKSPIVSKYDMSSLKVLVSAAAPLGAELEKECMDRFPGILCKQAWGMSELSPIGTWTEDKFPKFGTGTVGPPVASTSVKVVDPKTKKALPPNKEGELMIKGPQVMLGYLDEPQKTEECLTNEGWLSTGDIAKIDEEGYVYITDRLKELIKYKGFQVAPAELEAVLLTHPKVLDAVVIPRPDKEAEEVPRAYCVLKPNTTASPEEIVEFAAKETAPYKKIRGGVIFVDKIPKTASGKILRREVVQMDRKNYPV